MGTGVSGLFQAHFQTMREVFPGIFTWGSTYVDRPWDLNGYAMVLDSGTLLIDPPAPDEGGWQTLPAAITTIVLTNRDHVREAPLFQKRYGARLIAGKNELAQLTPLKIDQAVQESDLIAGVLQVIDLPGKSPGEIGLYVDPVHHPVSRQLGGIILLGDAIIGNPPGSLGLIPEQKIDDSETLRQSLLKLLDYDFEVLLLCDGQSVLNGAKLKVKEFLCE
jgi:glyoxylase-like metal-dependent hydrolase (beta-lactamase superfamily II)